MKQILCDQNDAYIPVMATSRIQFAHLLSIDVVLQIVKDHEARFAVCISKVLRYTIVKSDIRRQLLTGGHSTLLALRLHYSTGKSSLGTEVVEVL